MCHSIFLCCSHVWNASPTCLLTYLFFLSLTHFYQYTMFTTRQSCISQSYHFTCHRSGQCTHCEGGNGTVPLDSDDTIPLSAKWHYSPVCYMSCNPCQPPAISVVTLVWICPILNTACGAARCHHFWGKREQTLSLTLGQLRWYLQISLRNWTI